MRIDHNMSVFPPYQRVDVDGFIAPERENENIHFHLSDAEIQAFLVEGEVRAGDGEEDEDAEGRKGRRKRSRVRHS